MKKIFKLFFIVSLFFLMFSESFAIDAPTNLKLDSKTDSSVSLSWDMVDGAFMYSVYYGKQSGLDSTYDFQTDYDESNSYTITGLDKGETYYFSVKAVDESINESEYSNEVITDIAENNENFALKSIEALALNKIELTFSSPLEDTQDSVREFKITNKNDPIDSFEVVDTKINEDDNTKLELTLDRDTSIGQEYEVIVVAINSFDGQNIESGIDSSEFFVVNESVLNNNTMEETTNTQVEENIELNSAVEEQIETENTVLNTAETSSELPQTGPENIILFLISIILGAIVFSFSVRRT